MPVQGVHGLVSLTDFGFVPLEQDGMLTGARPSIMDKKTDIVESITSEKIG